MSGLNLVAKSKDLLANLSSVQANSPNTVRANTQFVVSRARSPTQIISCQKSGDVKRARRLTPVPSQNTSRRRTTRSARSVASPSDDFLFLDEESSDDRGYNGAEVDAGQRSVKTQPDRPSIDHFSQAESSWYRRILPGFLINRKPNLGGGKPGEDDVDDQCVSKTVAKRQVTSHIRQRLFAAMVLAAGMGLLLYSRGKVLGKLGALATAESIDQNIKDCGQEALLNAINEDAL